MLDEFAFALGGAEGNGRTLFPAIPDGREAALHCNSNKNQLAFIIQPSFLKRIFARTSAIDACFQPIILVTH
jgi:hypothetical protein